MMPHSALDLGTATSAMGGEVHVSMCNPKNEDLFLAARYGYFVGCNNLGEFPFPTYQIYYEGAKQRSQKGPCFDGIGTFHAVLPQVVHTSRTMPSQHVAGLSEAEVKLEEVSASVQEKDAACIKDQPGGLCARTLDPHCDFVSSTPTVQRNDSSATDVVISEEGTPTGAGDCTYSIEHAGAALEALQAVTSFEVLVYSLTC